MRYTLYVLVLVLLFVNSRAQTTSIPDSNFEQALINLGYDVGIPDGKVPTHNIDTITYLHIPEKNISDLSGIEDFVALEYLECFGNQLTNLDMSNNTFLEYLGCGANLLTRVDVSKNTNLSQLYCGDNRLTELDISNNVNLTNLHCWINRLTSLDLTKNINLIGLGCGKNKISELNLTHNIALTSVSYSDNNLTCLNLKNRNSEKKSHLHSSNNPGLTCIDVDNTT